MDSVMAVIGMMTMTCNYDRTSAYEFKCHYAASADTIIYVAGRVAQVAVPPHLLLLQVIQREQVFRKIAKRRQRLLGSLKRESNN